MMPIIRFLSGGLIQDKNLSPTQVDYEIFTFQYVDKYHLPTFETNQQEQEPFDYGGTSINEIEYMYMEGYNQEKMDKNSYFDYMIQSDDTLFGLELKFNITKSKILEINQISESMIFPGMKIQLPIQLQNVLECGQAQEVDFSLRPRRGSSSYIGVNLMDEIVSRGQSKKCTKIEQVHVQYITDQSCIAGVLTVNEDILFFDPIVLDDMIQSINGSTQNMKHQASINLKDINTVNVVELPTRLSQSGNEMTKEYILHLLLSAIGKKSFEEKYKKKLIRMKHNNVPLASIYLRLLEQTVQQKKEVQEIADMINTLIGKKTKDSDSPSRSELMTSLPYFDLMRDNISDSDNLIQRTNKIWGASCVIPTLMDVSETVNQDQFVSIVSHMPSVFKVGEWKLLFSNNRHGSSLQTLLRQVCDRSPLILIIKDVDSYVYGAYLSESLRMNKGQFYGSGETFLYTFENKNVIKTFKWSLMNQDFILCDHDGIAVGCGDKFGLYINNDLSEGYTAFCSTFMNDLLSKSGPFTIDVIEIWAMELDQ